jgi:NAD-reducing hydrogenase small subunit
MTMSDSERGQSGADRGAEVIPNIGSPGGSGTGAQTRTYPGAGEAQGGGGPLADPEAPQKLAGQPEEARGKVKLATVWLEGCSGCHMSFLDMDERLIALSDRVEVVYSPLVDMKSCPSDVDVTLVEGAVATEEDVRKMRSIRRKTKVLISLGDCAVTGNVPSMRNNIKIEDVYDRAYQENAAIQKQRPTLKLPVLLERVRPVHELVEVDVHIPGCPPPADAIFYILTELLEGRSPDISKVTRFGR